MQFYAFENDTTTSSGKHKGDLHVFDSRLERDGWVAEDKQCRTALKVGNSIVQGCRGEQVSKHTVIEHRDDEMLLQTSGGKRLVMETADTAAEMRDKMDL